MTFDSRSIQLAKLIGTVLETHVNLSDGDRQCRKATMTINGVKWRLSLMSVGPRLSILGGILPITHIVTINHNRNDITVKGTPVLKTFHCST